MQYMNYYRKTVNNTANDIKLKMQMGSLILKTTENIDKINNLLKVDEEIKKDVSDNLNLINSNKNIIEGKVSKLDRNLILFNTNLTNFIDSNKNNIDKIPNIENDITKNHLFTQVNKEKTEFNLNLIDNHTNNVKSINISLNNIKNDINTVDSNIYTPISKPKYILDDIYLFNLDFEKNFNFLADIKKIMVYEMTIENDF